MSNIQKNFERSLILYENKAPFLPPKISWKLDLILYMIQGNIPNKDLLSIQQQMQFEDLQNLDIHSLKLVFNNIIDTLFTKQVIDMKKCMLKKKGLLSSWVNAEILHDKRNFLINYSRKTYTYEKTGCQIKISKESKRSMELYFHKSFKYTLKFQNEPEMKSIWQAWQKQIIETKTQKNYEEMKTFSDLQNTSTLMERISLFHPAEVKKPFSPQKTSFSPQTTPFKSHVKQITLNKSFMVNQETKKKITQQQTIQLKPVPYGYISKLKNERSVIAMSRDENAKIYVEHIFDGKYHQKRLLSLLLLQKTWNSFIVLESVQKSQNSQNQIFVNRKYDSLKQLGQYAETNIKATYTPWNSKMSMIIIQTQKQQQNQEQFSLFSKSIITFEAQDGHVRISIQDELKSKKHSNQQLKKVLYEMYSEITKLQFIQDKIIFKDFQAQTLITNMLEDDQSTNTESAEDLSSIQNFQSTKIYNKTSSKSLDEVETDLNESVYERSKKQPSMKVLRLKSPLQYPNQEYLRLIRNKEFEKNYFKFHFPQENLENFDDYIPYYRLDKMLEAKVYEITPSRQLKFIDQQLLDSQKQTLRFVLRQIGANLISGKSVLNVSLPVDIFEPRTGLERSAASFACCPDYLMPMAQSSPIEQLKYVTGFILNVISCELVMQKPFNPILGETFQGYIRGIPIYYEQTSHSPPISSYYMKCNEFTLYGNLIPFADVGLNTGVGGNLGPMNIIFANGSHFECYFPPSQIAGLIYGDRKFRCYNKGFIFQKKNKIYAEFSIQNQKKGVYESSIKLKGGQIIGGIFKVKQQFVDEIEKFRKQHKNLKKFSGISKQHIIEKCHTISGEWFTNVFVDSVVINQDKTVYPVEYAKNILPSDSNHRLDVLYHKVKDLTHSQKEKQILQVIQRNDRKLREKYGFSSH